MSGIAGLFYREGRPVELNQLEAMGSALAHRGPDGISYYHRGSVGLVHCMLYDTPESFLEKLPNRTEDEKFVITFQGRIDNRQDLYDTIGWGKPLSDVTDSDLVLASYRKWRNQCVDFLLGDFTFAVWDQTEHIMFCARDRMGVKPFYYYLSDKLFAFASEIKGLLALSEIPRILNKERAADFFACVVADKDTTFYRNIFRLPPAHFFEVNLNTKRLCKYFEFQQPECQPKSSREYEEEFADIFQKALRCRIRSAFPVGSYLSGGLDSSSIVSTISATLQDELTCPLHTFSGIFDTVQDCDERQYFQSVLDRYKLDHHFIHADTLQPSRSYEELIAVADEPPFSAHFFMKWNLSCMAKDIGIRIMLDGHDGDSAVSYGLGLFYELAMKGDIRSLMSEYQAFYGSDIPASFKKIIRLYLSLVKETVPIPFYPSLEKRRLRESLDILNTHLIKETDIKNRLLATFRQQPVPLQTERESHLRSILQPLQPYALEFLEMLGSSFSLNIRFPFFDTRLINYCIMLPSNEKFQRGYNRSIVRRGLANYLPRAISERKKKTDFSHNIINAFSILDKDWILNSLDNLSASTYDFINIRNLETCVTNFFDTKKNLRQTFLYTILRVITFDKWMQRNKCNIK